MGKVFKSNDSTKRYFKGDLVSLGWFIVCQGYSSQPSSQVLQIRTIDCRVFEVSKQMIHLRKSRVQDILVENRIVERERKVWVQTVIVGSSFRSLCHKIILRNQESNFQKASAGSLQACPFMLSEVMLFTLKRSLSEVDWSGTSCCTIPTVFFGLLKWVDMLYQEMMGSGIVMTTRSLLRVCVRQGNTIRSIFNNLIHLGVWRKGLTLQKMFAINGYSFNLDLKLYKDWTANLKRVWILAGYKIPQMKLRGNGKVVLRIKSLCNKPQITRSRCQSSQRILWKESVLINQGGESYKQTHLDRGEDHLSSFCWAYQRSPWFPYPFYTSWE